MIGIGEPGARPRPGRYFKLAPVLGLDRDAGDRVANGKYKYAGPGEGLAPHFITAEARMPLDFGKPVDGIYVFDDATQVLAERDGSPCIAVHAFGRGRSVYLAGFKFGFENTRLLHRAVFWAGGREKGWGAWQSSNIRTEASWFARAGKLVVINNAGTDEETSVTLEDGRARRQTQLPAHGIRIFDL